MAQTPLQIVESRDEYVHMLLDGVRDARQTGNFYFAAANYSQAFSSRLLQGLVLWHHNLGDPRPALQQALEVSHSALDDLAALSVGVSIWKHFDRTPAIYLSYLLSGAAGPLFCDSPHDCQFPLWQTDHMAYARQALDIGLLQAVATGAPDASWEDAISTIAIKKRMRLLAETYRTYMALLLAARAANWPAVVAAASQAVGFYSQRSRNDFYSNGATDGGGPYNPLVVDYRLAALVKCTGADFVAFPKKVLPHLWRWS